MCLECVGCASRAGGVCCLGESVSRSGESLLPKREFEEHSDGGLSRSPSERWDSWVKRDLSQASVTCLSEGSWLVLCMVLA